MARTKLMDLPFSEELSDDDMDAIHGGTRRARVAARTRAVNAASRHGRGPGRAAAGWGYGYHDSSRHDPNIRTNPAANVRTRT